MSLGVDAALYTSSPANTVYPEYETPEPAPLAGSPRIPARTALQMPSAPMSTSPWTRSPLSRTAVTVPSFSYSYDEIAAPLRTLWLIRESSVSCRSGRSITHVYGMLRTFAGVPRSNLAYHSSRMPSLMPFVRFPVHVTCASISSYSDSSIARKFCIAFDASWIGPPKRLNSVVRSSTVYSTGTDVSWSACCRQFASARPPTPAPQMSTRRGSFSETSSETERRAAPATACAEICAARRGVDGAVTRPPFSTSPWAARRRVSGIQ